MNGIHDLSFPHRMKLQGDVACKRFDMKHDWTWDRKQLELAM